MSPFYNLPHLFRMTSRLDGPRRRRAAKPDWHDGGWGMGDGGWVSLPATPTCMPGVIRARHRWIIALIGLRQDGQGRPRTSYQMWVSR